MATSAKGIFKVTLDYFRPSGKWYAQGEFTGEFTEIMDGPRPGVYLYDVTHKVTQMRQLGELPGLAPGSRWSDGLILVRCEGCGYPHLLLPDRIQR